MSHQTYRINFLYIFITFSFFKCLGTIVILYIIICSIALKFNFPFKYWMISILFNFCPLFNVILIYTTFRCQYIFNFLLQPYARILCIVDIFNRILFKFLLLLFINILCIILLQYSGISFFYLYGLIISFTLTYKVFISRNIILLFI